MAKRKRYKKTNNDLQNIHIKLKIESPLKTGGETRCSGRESSSTGVNLVTNPVISHERGKDREVFTTSGTYPWSFVTQTLHSGQPSHGESDMFLHTT